MVVDERGKRTLTSMKTASVPGALGKVDPKRKRQDKRESSSPAPMTTFQRRVFAACAQIPKGRVATYQALAAFVGSHPRAVGQALKRNPYAPAVPCHRVITSGLQLGGFSGKWHPDSEEVRRKKQLLSDEGVQFNFLKPSANEVLQDEEKLFDGFDSAISAWEPPGARSAAARAMSPEQNSLV